MKFDVLASIAHDIADSLSGCSFVTNCHGLSPFKDAARSAGGVVEMDLLTGRCTPWRCVRRIEDRRCDRRLAALSKLCAKAGGSSSEFKTLLVRLWSARPGLASK